ncbi:MAG: DUF3604 domain-containing protein [Bryobacteraceae bacterium]|nr:DUF3604 domain-containing protein [Bryobacteraceae bacterium]MDW8379556.1 DUF3604 domain-containing protein [Bryobacterales bacterium]
MQRLALALVFVAVASLAFVLSQQGPPSPAGSGGEALQIDTAAVRIEFGLNDQEPRSWKGSVSARGGRILSVRNWRPRPGDRVEANSWILSTRRGPNFTPRAWETESLTDPMRYFLIPGVVVDVQGSQTELDIETERGRFQVRPFDLVPGSRASFLDGAVAVERTLAAEKLSPDGSNNDFSALVSLGDGKLVSGWVNFDGQRNQLQFRFFDGKTWSGVSTIARHSDIFLVKLGRDRANRPWAVWSAQVDGNWDLFASMWNGTRWSEPVQLTQDPQPDIYHALASDAQGNLWLVWQGFRNGKSDIFARKHTGESWTEAERVSESVANDWSPAIATDSRGRVYIAWDTYDKGNYDIHFRSWDGSRWSGVAAIADTPKFEAYVSLAVDAQNRLWAAWNEAGMDWGKDTGFLLVKQGTPIYKDRWMAVAVREGDSWSEPLQPPESSLPPTMRDHNDLPVLTTAHDGRIWLSFRHRLLRILDLPSNTPAHRGAWEIYLTTYEGDRWRPAIQAPFSSGRQDMRYGLAASGSGLFAVWPTDHRDFEEFLYTRAEVFAARIPLPPPSTRPPQLKPRNQPELKLFPTHYSEAEDLKRIRAYEIVHDGKTYRIYRGDTHRHTEFSMDGNNDGSLLDAYRYAMDAADLDFLLVSEHNVLGGPDNPYINWLLQQMADLMHLGGKFTPFYGYERSVSYPNGHRNVLFAKRGIPTLPIPPSEAKSLTGAKPLYEYLKKNQGIAISHTSASNMGTDWRDNDQEVEPLVEIYQGDRVSSEYEGAPKAAHAGNPASAPGGFRPLGYVWNAWAKGYKLGVQAASDHLSTHISYACTISTGGSREQLLDAMKARHSYAATDNIVLDYRMRANGREYLQGDIAEVKGDFSLVIKVLATAPIRQLDIIRSNQFILTRHLLGKEVDFEFRDSSPLNGESFYYVRVQQVDDQMAWSSPIWIKR